MASYLFVSQAMLDSWAEQGKIDIAGNTMTILTGGGTGRAYALEPAVRFMKILSSETDPHALLAKVKTPTQLKELGAEHLGDSVVLGDSAYEVQPGFLAEVSALQAAAAAQAAPQHAAPVRANTGEFQIPAELRDPKRVPGAPAPAPRAPAAAPTAAVPASTAAPAAAGAKPPGPGEKALPKPLEDRKQEADLLAKFLLDNLS
jgi:hypothetical protein